MKKLIFPALLVFWLVLMLVSRAFPRFFIPGADYDCLFGALVCAVLSWVVFVTIRE